MYFVKEQPSDRDDLEVTPNDIPIGSILLGAYYHDVPGGFVILEDRDLEFRIEGSATADMRGDRWFQEATDLTEQQRERGAVLLLAENRFGTTHIPGIGIRSGMLIIIHGGE
jgi:hypothetical protein